ncbi:MAG: ComEC family competence protein [Candidatus Pacebacteria bacterium]|nr:ComEC family competence protein [Candidatus Paceibacterota bacterium]
MSSNLLFYTGTISLVLGILLQTLYPLGLAHMLLWVMVSFVAAVLWRVKGSQSGSPLLLMSVALLGFVIGLVRMDVGQAEVFPLASSVGREVKLEGVVVREPEVRTNTTHLYTRVVETDELVLVFADRYSEYRYGDRISVTGFVRVPEKFETILGREFDYPGYLRARGVAHMVQFGEVDVLGRGEGNAFFTKLLAVKQSFVATLERIIPEPHVGLGEGLLLGMKRALGAELEEVFRVTGIIHIVVLSGYNVMLVTEAIMRVLALFLMPRMRMVCGLIGIGVFALLVGFSATVVRASLMAALLIVARTTGRIYAVLRALMIAGVGMLLINPYLLVYDPGFQLSFLATLGLIVLAPLIEANLSLVPTRFQMREFLTATVSTQLFVSPYLLFLIGELSIVAVAVNVLVLPMVPVAMLLTFITGILGAVSGVVAQGVGFIAHGSLAYIIVIAEWFATLPITTVKAPVFSFWYVVFSYGLMVWFIVWYTTREQKVAAEASNDSYLDNWVIEEEPENMSPRSGSLPFR